MRRRPLKVVLRAHPVADGLERLSKAVQLVIAHADGCGDGGHRQDFEAARAGPHRSNHSKNEAMP